MKRLSERHRFIRRFHAQVVELVLGVRLAGEVLALHDERGMVAAIVPAEEYRRLKALDQVDGD